jgi:hypothetical protein
LAEVVGEEVVWFAVEALVGGEALGAAGGAGEAGEVCGEEVALRALAALGGGVDEAAAGGGCGEEQKQGKSLQEMHIHYSVNYTDL